MLPEQGLAMRSQRRRPQPQRPIRMMLVLVALLACSVLCAQAQPLWNEAAGDNTNLGNLFAPPPQQQQQGPTSLEMWQHQQSGQAQQQQQQQPATTQAILTELAVALLRAATASQQPQQQQQMQQQQPMQGFGGGFAPSQQQQQPFRNLYGAQAPPQQQQSPQDLALLSQNAQQRDTILPLFSKGSNAYGFSVPPADVQQKMRRMQKKPISDVQRFARISNKVDPIAQWMRNHPARPINLDSAVAHHPDREIAPPPAQKQFHLKTRHFRRSALEPVHDAKAMRAMQQENPFGSAAASEQLDVADDISALESPAMLAFSEAEKAMQDADSSMDPAMLETQASAGAHSKLKSKLAARRRPGRNAPKSEFAQPSADFSRMFRSIMQARKTTNKKE